PVTYALAAGALPVGLSLSSLGEIGGIPTAAGAFDFTVEATDATGHTALRAYTIDIPTCVPAPAGLVSWWQGESDASDSATLHHGTLEGGVTFAPGRFGQAFNLNGTDAYVSVPDSPALRLGTEFTVDFWMNKEAETPDYQL